MIYWTHFKKYLRYNEHNIPVKPDKMLGYLSLNIGCSLKLTVFLWSCPTLSSFFGTDNVLHLQFVIDYTSMEGVEQTWRPFLLLYCFLFYNMVSEVRFQLETGKIAASLGGSCLSLILHRQLQRIFFYLQIHSLNLGKEENLSFDIILFVYDLSVINKISLFDLTVCSQREGGRW